MLLIAFTTKLIFLRNFVRESKQLQKPKSVDKKSFNVVASCNLCRWNDEQKSGNKIFYCRCFVLALKVKRQRNLATKSRSMSLLPIIFECEMTGELRPSPGSERICKAPAPWAKGSRDQGQSVTA
jgi:hypothetical protein